VAHHKAAKMASLFQPVVIRYVIRDESGHELHRDADGKHVNKNTPGAIRKKSKSETWWGKYRDSQGNLQRVSFPGLGKTAARKQLQELEVTARQMARGLVSDFEAPSKRPLADHLADFEKSLHSNGSSEGHVQKTAGRAKKVILGCGFVFIRDINASKVQEHLASMEESEGLPVLPAGQTAFKSRELAKLWGVPVSTIVALVRRYRMAGIGNGKARRYAREVAEAVRDRLRRGHGAATIGYYLRAARQFCQFLVADRRTPINPLIHLSTASPESDLRHDRRSLTEAETDRLLSAARSSKRKFRGLTGETRAIIYCVGLVSGFRKSEIAILTPESFRLDDTPPCITLGASESKNGKAVSQPIPNDVAAMLKAYLVNKPKGRPIFPGTWSERGADMLRVDLHSAGIPYAVEGPDGLLFADFHSLRHSFVSRLDRAGVSLKQAMVLARHSSPTLTAKRYGKPDMDELSVAVEKMKPIAQGPNLAMWYNAGATQALAAQEMMPEALNGQPLRVDFCFGFHGIIRPTLLPLSYRRR
jgi:integrase